MTGDDILGRLDELIARGPPAAQHGDRPAARATSATACCPPTPTSAWRRSSRRSRRGADVVVTGRVTDTGLTLGPDLPRVRLGAGRLGQGRRRDRRRPHHRMRRAVLRRQLLKDWRAVKGLANPGFPIVEASPDGTLRRHQASRHRRRRLGRVGHRAAGLRDGRSAELHHARRRRRFHHHPAEAGGQGPGAGERNPRRPARRRCSRSRSPTSTATRRSARWCTPGPRPTTRRRRPTASCASGSTDLGLEFEQILTEFVGVDATHGRAERAASIRTASRGAAARRGAGARTGRRSSGSPARSRRWCSPGRPASPDSPAAGRRSRRSWPTGRR